MRGVINTENTEVSHIQSDPLMNCSMNLFCSDSTFVKASYSVRYLNTWTHYYTVNSKEVYLHEQLFGRIQYTEKKICA